MGLLMVAIAACQPSTAPNDTEAPSSTSDSMAEPPPESPAAPPIDERSAYSEVSLPQESLLVGDDPQQIALSAFGNSEPPGEGNFKEEVVLVEQTANQALVSLTQTGLLDDSVEGMRYRLEFVPEGTQWQLAWAGRQVRCRPNRGSQTWTTELCQ